MYSFIPYFLLFGYKNTHSYHDNHQLHLHNQTMASHNNVAKGAAEQLTILNQRKQLLVHGAVMFFFALVFPLFQPLALNSRAVLTYVAKKDVMLMDAFANWTMIYNCRCHLEGTQNGLVLLVWGILWPELALGPTTR